MERSLIFIKHHLRFLWTIIERINSLFFHFLYKKRLRQILNRIFKESAASKIIYRNLELSDLEILQNMIEAQDPDDLKYFQPHDFDSEALNKQYRKQSFLMMGAFDEDKLVGYFFLRFFINRKCFVGRIIDKEYRGTGVGKGMNKIMYETAWQMNFRCLSTISRNNIAIMRAHANNRNMVVLKELQNNYLLVEFTNKQKSK